MSLVASTAYVFPFDNEVKEYAQKQLNETEESRKQCMEEIQRWLKEERPDLHAKNDVASILSFLRGSKFRLDSAKEKITNFYTMKKEMPQWYENRNPLLPEITELVKLGVFIPLRTLHENRLVVIIRTAAHNPSKHKMDDVFKAGIMVLDIAALEYELATIYGVTAIFDMAGLSFGHYRQLTPNMIMNIVYAWHNYYVRPKHLEFFNAPVYINVVLNIFRRFMSEKMKNRLKVNYGGYEAMHELVDKKLLPKEYGGNGESVKDLCDYWYDKLVSYKEWFIDDEFHKAE